MPVDARKPARYGLGMSNTNQRPHRQFSMGDGVTSAYTGKMHGTVTKIRFSADQGWLYEVMWAATEDCPEMYAWYTQDSLRHDYSTLIARHHGGRDD